MRPYLAIAITSACCAQLLIGGCSASESTSDGNAGAASGQAGATSPGGSSSGGAAGGQTPQAGAGASGAGANGGATAGGADNAGASNDAGAAGSTDTPCTTRVSYGNALDTAKHPNEVEELDGTVSWDGVCTNEGNNSYALLSDGTKRYFVGKGQCVVALDASCSASTKCATRITYGAAWQKGASHPAQYDQVTGRVFWDGACTNSGANSLTTLSNGWAPHFDGNNACSMSFRYEQCGGLYTNPVIPSGCADPGVVRDGSTYYLSCTSGGAPNAFLIRSSTDLVHWTNVGAIFPTGTKPKWTTGDFWAPEIHRVGTHWVAYYTARHTDGKLSIGAASADKPTGPFTDLGQPLIHDANMGMIDANKFDGADGTPYLVWKADGNASGKPTPIYGQRLSGDGMALTGTRQELITNDQAWEGGVVEGPWVVLRGGRYYMFYSGNSYANGTYAVGVARASSPLGPYVKAGPPIVKTNATWVGPGHNSVVDTPEGDSYMVYHAWPVAHTGRVTLVDAIRWGDEWPSVPEAPSVSSRPMP